MALEKSTKQDKIEIVDCGDWKVLQVRTATIVTDDGAELSRSFHRHVLDPFISTYKTKDSEDGKLALPDRDADGKLQWTHTATDLSGEDASVKAIAEAAWTDDVKTAYKTFMENQDI